MDWLPQASGVFISRVRLVAQVIPGIKGYAWITAASFPLVQGLKTPHHHTSSPCLRMKTDRKLCSLGRLDVIARQMMWKSNKKPLPRDSSSWPSDTGHEEYELPMCL
ncbi:unnamed protein product [Pleuronectes platessa]|uniref:Uncharacterized protein n=1 Tax=Pleuronectes platessa TaxID=8262 RepID=A0A9N7YGP3_PLEPL|nr:unnamed protein product [Pleuronectes platessa]